MPRHDAVLDSGVMDNRPREDSAELPDRGKLRALFRDFGDHWEIEQGAAWVACTRNGSFVHVIAAHNLDDLRDRIEAAIDEETTQGS
jgi:hypothetical protein